MNKCLRFVLPLLLLLSLYTQAATRKVLFIGNSYIYTNDMPLILHSLAASMGDTLVYDQSTVGGYTLQSHSQDANTIAKIFSQQWDIVVIQGQSQEPAFSPAQVASQTLPYAHILDSMVHANDSCTQVMFMMTWGYKNGDASNCAGYPPICTYGGMQQRLRESYTLMSQQNNALTAPVGAAWKMVRDSFPALELYMPDESHPVVAGSYLESCVLYASIFHKDPYGSTYFNTLSATDAHNLQRIGGRVVLDSITYWQQYGHYPYASFTHAAAGNTVTFTNHSFSASNYHWTFGDANTSNSLSPVHSYAATGVYTVTLTVSDSCFSESISDTVHIGNVSVAGIDKTTAHLNITHEADGRVHFSVLGYTEAYALTVYNANGQKVFQAIEQNETSAGFAPGIYFVRLSGTKSNGNTVYTAKFIVP